MKKSRSRRYEGGEGEEAPAEEEPAAAEEEEPLVEEKPEEAVEPSEKKPRIEDEMCCCCICRCQGEEDKPYSCCGCFPIKCGLVFIGILTIFITLALFVEVYWTLLNEYIHWWYVIVGTVCLIPLVVATVFVIRFFTKDQKASRTRFWIAMLLAIVSFTLLALWNLIYFQWVYKYDFVYVGIDGLGYTQQPKKGVMVWSLFIGLVFDFIWGYFLCVATKYATCKDGAPEPIDYTGGMGDKMGDMTNMGNNDS
jgi:hypothetical protein